MKKLLLVVGSLMLPDLLTACAHSGVVPIGPDTYMIANSEWGFTSGDYQKAKAMKEANEFCNSHGKVALLISSEQHGVRFGKTPSAEIQFRCLAASTK